jgi:hypothetical protein
MTFDPNFTQIIMPIRASVLVRLVITPEAPNSLRGTFQ